MSEPRIGKDKDTGNCLILWENGEALSRIGKDWLNGIHFTAMEVYDLQKVTDPFERSDILFDSRDYARNHCMDWMKDK